ncbi:MAG: tyrosine-type recombinase/integrase [Bacteroidales bacterium]|nr:tyrosine-type recombinase/integrase [Bacteroidales bacterium]
MKSLPLYNQDYQNQIENFRAYLHAIGLNEGTQNMLPSCIREFLHQIEQQGINQLQNIQQNQIQNHYEYLQHRPNQRRTGNLSNSMLNHHMYAIRKFFNYLEQTNGITTNPTSNLEFKRLKSKEREILTTWGIKLLYRVTATLREKAILGIFYGCGLRRTEGEKLNINDINLKTKLLYVREGKGKRRRVIPINKQVNEDFKNYLYCERGEYIKNKSPKDAFILNKIGNRMSGSSYNDTLKEIIERAKQAKPAFAEAMAGKEISLHNLRHSIATHLLENGLPIEYVRDFLGHQYLEATQIYTRVDLKKL